jgi:hypothetical protein
MSSGLPTASIVGNSGAPAATMQAPPITSGPAASINSVPVLDPALVLYLAERSTAICYLILAVSNLRTFLQGPYAPPPPSQGPAAPLPPPPAGAFAQPSPATTSHQGIPITQIRFPPSPSQLPAWLNAPVFTTAPAQPTVLQHHVTFDHRPRGCHRVQRPLRRGFHGAELLAPDTSQTYL